MAFSVEIQQELDALLLPWDDVSPRNMFGAMVYLVKGKMFAFVYDNRVIVKVPKEKQGSSGIANESQPLYSRPHRAFW